WELNLNAHLSILVVSTRAGPVVIADSSVGAVDAETLEAIVVFGYLWAKFKHHATTVIGGELNNNGNSLNTIENGAIERRGKLRNEIRRAYLSSIVCSSDDTFVVSSTLVGVGVSWGITATVLLVLLDISAPYTSIVPPEGLLGSRELVRSTENRRSGKWSVHKAMWLNKGKPSSEDE
ncbi:hypothetical protein Bhyg_01363, partial [Pseudolycoriella hygida]